MRFAQPETWFQHPTIFGAVLGILTLSAAFLLPRDAAIQFAAITLAVTGGAYARLCAAGLQKPDLMG